MSASINIQEDDYNALCLHLERARASLDLLCTLEHAGAAENLSAETLATAVAHAAEQLGGALQRLHGGPR